MLIHIVDIINSFVQAILFVYIVNACIKSKDSSLKMLKVVLIMFFCMETFTIGFGNLSICVFLIHIAEIIVLLLMYKREFYSALIAYTIIYFFIVINVTIFGNLFFGYFKNLVEIQYIDFLMLIVVYIPQFVMGFLCIRFKNKILNFHKEILNLNLSIISLIIINFSFDFILAFYLIFYTEESEVLKNISVVSCLTFFGISAMYFLKIHMKSNKILALNRSLDSKNTELRKIQNNYAKQISYMYDLYSMKRVDKVGEKLKFIINNNNQDNNNDSITDYKVNTLIGSIVNKIKSKEKEIDIIVEDDGNLDKTKISEMELYRIVSNIVNNAVKAMNGTGIIIIKTYDLNQSLVIHIENNGPKIELENIHKIFESGFTTKNNVDKNHGYGLNIVKELVEKYNGIITVKSTDKSTKFEIKVPFDKSNI